jgi:hypothetical protein
VITKDELVAAVVASLDEEPHGVSFRRNVHEARGVRYQSEGLAHASSLGHSSGGKLRKNPGSSTNNHR